MCFGTMMAINKLSQMRVDVHSEWGAFVRPPAAATLSLFILSLTISTFKWFCTIMVAAVWSGYEITLLRNPYLNLLYLGPPAFCGSHRFDKFCEASVSPGANTP